MGIYPGSKCIGIWPCIWCSYTPSLGLILADITLNTIIVETRNCKNHQKKWETIYLNAAHDRLNMTSYCFVQDSHSPFLVSSTLKPKETWTSVIRRRHMDTSTVEPHPLRPHSDCAAQSGIRTSLRSSVMHSHPRQWSPVVRAVLKKLEGHTLWETHCQFREGSSHPLAASQVAAGCCAEALTGCFLHGVVQAALVVFFPAPHSTGPHLFTSTWSFTLHALYSS